MRELPGRSGERDGARQAVRQTEAHPSSHAAQPDWLQAWKDAARRLKREVRALYLAYRDPRVPWHARVFAGAVVAYAFSPIDLIPDVVPVLGYLDDLVLVPLGIALAIRMIPPEVLAECRERALQEQDGHRPVNWAAAAVIAAVWLGLAALAVVYLARRLQ